MKVDWIYLEEPKRLFLFFVVFFSFSHSYTYADQNSVNTRSISDDQSKALEQYQFAEGMRTREFFDLAAIEYEKLIKNYPTFDHIPEAYFYWAECLRLNHQHEKAVDIFNDLRNQYANHPLATQSAINLAEIFIEADEFDKAGKTLNETLEHRQPDQKTREAIYYFLGEVYRKKQAFDRAVEVLSKIALMEIDSKYQYREYALLNLGFVYRNLKNNNQAVECFDRLVKAPEASEIIKEESLFQLGEIASLDENYVKAVEYYDRVLENYPKGQFDLPARINKSWALLHLKKYQEVLKFLDPDSSENIPVNGEILYIRGLCLKSLQQVEHALDIFQNLIKEFPSDKFKIYAEYDAIECLYELKDYERCLTSIDEFLAHFSSDKLASDVVYYQGRCLLALDRILDAIKVYEQALKRFGDNWDHAEESLIIVAETYRKTNQFKNAALAYKRLLKLGNSELKAKSLMLAAECESLSNDKKMAIQSYTKVIDDYPNTPEAPLALLYLAELKSSEEEYSQAIKYLDRYHSEFSEHKYVAKAFYLRGAFYYYMGKYDAAITDLKRSLGYSKFGEKDFAQLFLAYTLWEQNKEKESLQYLAELLKKESDVFEDNLIPELLSEMGTRYLELNDLAAAEICFTLIRDSSDPMLNLLGLLGLGKVEYYKQNFINAVKIFYDLKGKTAQYPELRGTSLAYLGESLRLSGNLDEAFVVFKEASGLVYDDSKAKALVRLGFAQIHFENNEFDNALRYAISVYVLYDDPIVAPEAMLIAIKILANQQRMDEAKSTYKELEGRYPAALASFKSKEENALLFGQL